MRTTPKAVKNEDAPTYQHRAAPGVIQAPANEVTVPPFAVTVLNDEPRVRDLDLAERLGFDRPRDIRKLIDRHRVEIDSFGICATVAQNHSGGRGRPTTEFYLNEEQSLLIATVSNAPAASVVRRALITTFVALRRGQSVPSLVNDDRKVIGGIMKAVVHKELAEAVHELLPSLVAKAITDQQYGIVRGLTAGAVVDLAGIGERKGLKRLPRRVSDRLRQVHAEKGVAVKQATLGKTKAYVFDEQLCRDWLIDGGKETIAMWAQEMRGQGVLRLVVKNNG